MTTPTIQRPAQATPARQRGPRLSLWVLRLALAVHALAAVAQPVLAGRYLSGDFDALAAHGINAGFVFLAAMAAFVAAVLYWLVGRGAGWPALVIAALIVAEIAQVAAGAQRVLAVHIPLGVGIVAAAVALGVWSFRPVARRARVWRFGRTSGGVPR